MWMMVTGYWTREQERRRIEEASGEKKKKDRRRSHQSGISAIVGTVIDPVPSRCRWERWPKAYTIIR